MCDSFETNFYEKPYVFCDENLSDYEKTIYILALAYADDPICRLTEKNISELSSFLKVDVQLLTKALQTETDFPYGCAVVQFGDEKIVCGDFFKNTFFDIITKVFWGYKNLDELFDSTDQDELNENLQVVPFFLELSALIAEDFVKTVCNLLGDIGRYLLHVRIALKVASRYVERDIR